MTIRVNREKKELQLSIRDLVFFGAINRRRHQFSFKSAEIGQEIHQKIQIEKQREDVNYQREYFIKYPFELNEWHIIIRGRIDLLIKSLDSVKIEEIKSIFLKDYTGSPDDPRIDVFKLQVQCYAWMLNRIESNLPHPTLELILYNLFDNTQYSVHIPYQNMSSFVEKKIKRILYEEEIKWKDHEKKRSLLENLQFPFSYRPYQKEIIQKINSILNKNLNLLIEAPSGLGKTVVSLYPVLSESIKNNTKVFFLTAKTTQRRIVEQTLNIFHKQGVNFLALTLKAKEKMCTNAFFFCHEAYCPFLRNYLDHYPEEFIHSFVQKRGIITPEMIEKEAISSDAFCPFELALDISLEADVIIGDYNYVFHPRVSLQRFFSEQVPSSKKGYYLIIDEAHNLVNRSLTYYSHSLKQRDIVGFKIKLGQLKKQFKNIPLPTFLPPKLEHYFRKMVTDHNTEVSTHILEEIDIEFFQKILSKFEVIITKYIQFLLKKELHWPDDPILDFYYHLKDFIDTAAIARSVDEFSILYNSHEGEVKILCKDASPFLQQRLTTFRSTIAMSATLTPFPFYRDLLGFPIDKTIYERYPSPFSPKRRKIIVLPNIDTRYKHRISFSEEIADIIQSILKIKRGKYFAFFPSFQFASKVIRSLKPIDDLLILRQTNLMEDSARHSFIRTLKTKPFVLAIAVTAGIFAEGIDFPGTLDGIFVISPSLPPVSFEREILRQYYDERFGNGFAYAYQFPGLTRTFQAAGRLIRTASDRGIIVFFGHRFATPLYADYFPPYYYQKSPKELISTEPQVEVKKFWKEMESNTDSSD
ncbi:MAG: ATP-dependent DNA helicase [Candidatus Hodarchaeota archaeon]